MKKNIARCSFFAALLMVFLSADFVQVGPQRISFIHDAHAVVGRPLTPVSYAGTTRRVARRTARRTTAVYAGAATAPVAVTAVPPATTVVVQEASPPAEVVVQQAPPPAAPAPATGTAVPVGTIIPALPDGCQSTVVAGATYFNCAEVHYKPAFQGSALVYVVVERPY